MTRRTITIEPGLDQIINAVRGLLLLLGKEYNYTEIVNGAIFYGICYWLNIPHKEAVKLASEILTTDLKMEGIQDELKERWDKVMGKVQ
ncbi:MAG: hypothetical protein PVF15_10520 [Candidatus Bathyarchaeota archaeon]|jgi:hypothetical protein